MRITRYITNRHGCVVGVEGRGVTPPLAPEQRARRNAKRQFAEMADWIVEHKPFDITIRVDGFSFVFVAPEVVTSPNGNRAVTCARMRCGS